MADRGSFHGTLMKHAQRTTGDARGSWLLIAGAVAIAIPGVALRLTHFSHEPMLEAALFGLAILAGAALLSSGAELAEQEVSRGLALAVVALIAVLPEYAVDMVFAWKAANDPAVCALAVPPPDVTCNAHFAAANMTGANRLLIGIGWAAVILLFWFRAGRRALVLEKRQSLDIVFLLISTVWAFTIFFRSLFRDGSLNLLDTGVLVAMFIGYMALSSRGKGKEQEPMVGPMAPLVHLPRAQRGAIIVFLFVIPALVILATAEPFAESLVETGKDIGIDEFILVQWIAPLASEAPEMAIACYFAFRGLGSIAMGVLVSSKVNQWTLLVGTLPLVYSISLGKAGELPLDNRQVDEFLLTSAQSLFAILLIITMHISWRAGLALLVLFVAQFFFTGETERVVYSLVYLGLAVAVLAVDRGARAATWGLLSRGVKGLRPGGAVASIGDG